MNCILCGHDGFVAVHETIPSRSSSGYRISEGRLEKPAKITKCANCGLVFSPEASLPEIARDYSEMTDQNYLKEEKGRRAQAKKVLSQIARYKSRGRLLDIGCGPGIFLDEAKKSGVGRYRS